MTNINSKIDTLQLITNINNVGITDVQQLKHMHKFISKIPLLSVNKAANKFKVNFVLQPSYYNNIYSDYNCYTEYARRLDSMLQSIHIKNNNDLAVTRLDICIDFADSYSDLFRLGKILLHLFDIQRHGVDNFLTTLNARTNRETHLRLSGSVFELAFYDKEAESSGKHYFKSRLEFRYKRRRIKKGHEVFIIKELIKELKDIRDSDMYKILEEAYANRIIDSIKYNNTTLISYVTSHRDEILTRDSLKRVYSNYYGNTTDQAFNVWYSKNKKKHSLHTYKINDIKAFIDSIIKSLKYFIRN